MGIDDIRWLKIAGTNGIVVDGKIQIAGVKITSWDTQTNSPVFQTIMGSFQEHLSTCEIAMVDLLIIQRLHTWDIRNLDEEALTFLEEMNLLIIWK
jgi:hypothetical protein